MSYSTIAMIDRAAQEANWSDGDRLRPEGRVAAQWLAWGTDAEQMALSRIPENRQKVSTLSLTPGIQSYTAPADLWHRNIVTATLSGTTMQPRDLRIVDHSELTRQRPGWDYAASAQSGIPSMIIFNPAAGNIQFDTIPDSNYTVALYHLRTPQRLALPGDVIWILRSARVPDSDDAAPAATYTADNEDPSFRLRNSVFDVPRRLWFQGDGDPLLLSYSIRLTAQLVNEAIADVDHTLSGVSSETIRETKLTYLKVTSVRLEPVAQGGGGEAVVNVGISNVFTPADGTADDTFDNGDYPVAFDVATEYSMLPDLWAPRIAPLYMACRICEQRGDREAALLLDARFRQELDAYAAEFSVQPGERVQVFGRRRVLIPR